LEEVKWGRGAGKMFQHLTCFIMGGKERREVLTEEKERIGTNEPESRTARGGTIKHTQYAKSIGRGHLDPSAGGQGPSV